MRKKCHSAAKRARVCATFTDSQENAIVEFVKQHPELYDKNGCFHDRQRKIGRIFRDIEAVKNTHRRQILPRGSATITKESQRVRILPPITQQASSSTQAEVPTVTSTTHPAPLALETLHQWSQYRTRAVDTS